MSERTYPFMLFSSLFFKFITEPTTDTANGMATADNLGEVQAINMCRHIPCFVSHRHNICLRFLFIFSTGGRFCASRSFPSNRSPAP